MKKRVPTEKEIARQHGVSVKYVIRQAEIGSTVEREHVTDHKAAYDIALQHIAEFPDYYKHLLPMEKKLKSEWKNKKTYKQIKESLVQEDHSPVEAETQVETQVDAEELMVQENHLAIAAGTELDNEGSMILNDLSELQYSIDMLRGVIKKPNMQVPAWVQSKITLASDYLRASARYMNSTYEQVLHKEEKENSEEKKYCRMCQKPETKDECSYGPKIWERFSVPILSKKK
jgi:hypothetical protein